METFWLSDMEVRQINVVIRMTHDHLSTSLTETYTEVLVEEICHNNIYVQHVKTLIQSSYKTINNFSASSSEYQNMHH